MPVIHAHTSNFESEIDTELPVLVDFWATWCAPCRAIAPHLEKLAKEYEGKAKVLKVDVEEAKALANQYKIVALPTLVVFRGGKEVKRHVGQSSLAQLKKLLD